MHLRRALLLFAVVLGLAAIAASVSRPAAEQPRRQVGQSPPAAAPAAPSTRATKISFDTTHRQVRRLAAGRAATVVVNADEAGMAEIPSLGLSASADPHTPARFEVLVGEPGRFPIAFRPAVGDQARRSGVLVITAAEQ